MKSLKPFLILALSSLLFLPGCDLIEGIFEAGFWAALLLIAAVIALIIWGISSFTGKRIDVKRSTGVDSSASGKR